MNRLNLSTALICFVAAFLFVAMLRYQYVDPSWSRFQPATSSPGSPRKPDEQETTASKSGCQETENGLKDLIGRARYCTVDSDCTLFDYGYPIDCMTSVAKAEITALRIEYRKYEQSCEHRVYFDCPTEPMLRRAVCEQNRCTVRLQSIDTLRETTRHYLGIDGQ